VNNRTFTILSGYRSPRELGFETLHHEKIAIIGGTGLEPLLESPKQFKVRTPYGISPPILRGTFGNCSVVFLPRHGLKHEVPPHKINYRADMWSLKKIGVERVISTNAVGAINEKYSVGDLVIPSDIIDFTKSRITTFHDKAPVIHVDMTTPYCPELREFLSSSLKKLGQQHWSGGVIAATEGPRFETPAEIRMMRSVGCDIVGMTGAPEVFLARELEMCYAAIGFVSNMAAGIQSRLTVEEVVAAARQSTPIIRRVLEDSISSILKERKCSCSKALEHAKM